MTPKGCGPTIISSELRSSRSKHLQRDARAGGRSSRPKANLGDSGNVFWGAEWDGLLLALFDPKKNHAVIRFGCAFIGECEYAQPQWIFL
jgi:hypothetical protein